MCFVGVQTLRDCFINVNVVTGEVMRVPTYFHLMSPHHRTLKDVVRVQHPEQRPLPFRYVVAVVSGIADALEAAANVGVVHLDIKEDNIMVDDPEAMEFEAEQIAADATVVDYRQCIRRFEEPPEAVVIDWGTAMQFDDDLVLRVPVRIVDGRVMLALPEGAQPWGNGSHASPELHIEWNRASDELERAKVAVVQANRAKITAEQGASSVRAAHTSCVAHPCCFRCMLLCRRRCG